MYVVCALLRNALTCLYGNQTSEFFSFTHPLCKTTLPKKSVEIWHLLHLSKELLEQSLTKFKIQNRWQVNAFLSDWLLMVSNGWKKLCM